MANETMTKLATYTVPSGGTSSVTISNIPQGYTDLIVKVTARTGRAAGADTLQVQYNGVTTGYSQKGMYGNGSSTTGYVSATIQELIWCTDTASVANSFGGGEIYIPNYSGYGQKSAYGDSVVTNNGAGYVALVSGLSTTTAPITSITFLSNTGNTILQNSSFTVYGIKNLVKTYGNSVRASGGNIAFDGTYTYHSFISSGSFVPTSNLTNVDVLVVAGGGAGGSAYAGPMPGGGGAGGVLAGTIPALSATTSYTVTVGAGGAGTNFQNGSAGNSGSNSVFNTATALGGGGGAGFDVGVSNNNGFGYVGYTGGSGGGCCMSGGYGGTVGGAAATQTSYGTLTGYGNASGSIGPQVSNCNGSGGGGAGGVGQSRVTTDTKGGDGGVGLATWTVWGAATGLGQNVSGTYYFAGGGGGASNVASSQGGYGGGGAGYGGGNGAGIAGTASTGGGGGGSYGVSPPVTKGANGGSGVVIIRYKA
jgi:hypothetical protein